MASKRRRPGTPPPTLTEEQRIMAHRCLPIGLHVAMYFARRQPAGLTRDDLVSAANEAVTLAVTTYSNLKVRIEVYVWGRVRSTLRNLIRQTAVKLGLRAPNDTHESRVAHTGADALDAYALHAKDPGNIWQDTREQQIEQYDEEANNAATALVTGGGGHVWHSRGELGLVLRAEYVRANKVLHDEVSRLPIAHATIIELRFFRELSRGETAQKAGVSESTVLRIIGEAIPLLRARLQARGITDLSFLEGK